MRYLLLFASFMMLIAGCGRQSGVAEPVQPTEAAEPSLDVWLEQLEVGSRELYSAREAVVDAVGLHPGDWIADIGAGTGLYSLLFAEKVSPGGQVFAEDIEPLFLDLIGQRAKDSDLSNVTAVLGREDDVTLPNASMDVVFIADTYHYFNDRKAVVESIKSALKPGGSLVLVEFRLAPGETPPDYKSHVRFGMQTVVSEIESLGFLFDGEVAVEGLEENYFIKLTKPAE